MQKESKNKRPFNTGNKTYHDITEILLDLLRGRQINTGGYYLAYQQF